MSDIPKCWRRRGLCAYALLPFSALFFLAAAYRRLRTRPQTANVPVIVVGNITLGGNGKTPVVIALAQALSRRGINVGVVSRGHGGENRVPQRVFADSDPCRCGDEPLLIAQQSGVPVMIGRDRPAAIDALLAQEYALDLIISDDGLQHYRMARQVELALVAPDLRLGNGFLLPAGPLRETPSRLNQVDAVLFCGDAPPFPEVRVPQFSLTMHNDRFYRLHDATPLATETLQRSSCAALTAIARPERFFQRLRALNIRPAATHSLPDHAPLTAQSAAFAADSEWLLLTAKDAVKTRDWPQDLRARAVVLDYRAELPEALLRLILQKTIHT